MDPGHDRLRRVVDGKEEIGESLGLAQVLLAREVGRGLHPLQVAPRAEGEATTPEHDHPHSVEGAQVEQGRAELGHHQAVEGVAHLGAVQPYPRHRPVQLDLQAFEMQSARPFETAVGPAYCAGGVRCRLCARAWALACPFPDPDRWARAPWR